MKNINIKNIVTDLKNNSDYTTTLEMVPTNELNLNFTINELEDALSTFNSVSMVSKLTPEQTEENYNNFYKYYNTYNNIISSIPIDNNEYPLTNWYPRDHNDQIGPDGTISINSEKCPAFNITDLARKQQKYKANSSYYSVQTYNIYTCQLEKTETTNDGYKIVNNKLTDNYHSKMISSDTQDSKYGFFYREDIRLSESIYYYTDDNNDKYEFSYYPTHASYLSPNPEQVLRYYEKNEEYIQYKLVNNLDIIQKHELQEYEIEYEFNEEKQINTLEGYIYNLSYDVLYHHHLVDYRYDDWNYYSYQFEPTITKPDPSNFSVVFLSVFGWDEEISDQLLMGYRSLSAPTIINLKKDIPLIPRKIKKIKLLVQQKIQFTEKEKLDDVVKVRENVYKQLKVMNLPLMGIRTIDNSFAFSPQMFPSYTACSKFLPGFDVSLLEGNVNRYTTLYDTRSFIKFKNHNTYIPTSKFIESRLILSERNYYPYLYDINLDSTTLSFNINKNCYKHNDIISNNAVESVDINVITYDYSSKNLNDSTITETYHISDIDSRISIDTSTAFIENHFINIKLNFNQTLDNIIETLTSVNLYTDNYYNYEYDLKLPEKNNINKLLRILEYRYDSTNGEITEITKENTNYIFTHTNITSVDIYSDTTVIPAIIQVSQIGDVGVISDHYINLLGEISLDSSEYTAINSGWNIIDLSSLIIDNDCKYLMIFASGKESNQTNNYEYSQKTKLFNFKYELPIISINFPNYQSIEDLEQLINDKDVVYYTTYTTKKV